MYYKEGNSKNKVVIWSCDCILSDKDGKEHKLSGFTSNFKVVYFYPKDSTPGCTIEANDFNANLEKFKGLNATVIGISGGDEKSKGKFCENYHLKFLLLSDTDFSISTAYGVYGEKKFMGRTFIGIIRVTYILDKNNKIIKIYEKVTPKGHADEIIAFLKSWHGV